MAKKFHTVAVRLAFRFSLLVTVAIIVLSFGFVGMLNLIVRSQKSDELHNACEKLEKSIVLDLDGEVKDRVMLDYDSVQVPYYISYVVYTKDLKSNEIQSIGTNDYYLPVLPLSGNSARKHVEKDFFIDGDLNIYYMTKEVSSFSIGGKKLIMQTSLNMETDSATTMYKQLPKAVLIIFLPVLIMSFFVALFITRHTIAPVKKITATAKHLSTTQLDTLLPVSKHDDEIDALAITFNELFKRIKQDFERERQFTGDVSHELKTPVAVIMGQSNLLKRWGKDDPVQLEKSIDTIVKESKSMSAIIENLLQISRIENGRIKPKLERFNITELYERIKEEAQSINSELIFDIESPERLYLIADKELLHQVLTVIVSNSLKYCGAAEVNPIRILCKASVSGDKVELSIKDNGPGFDEKTVEHCFERFYRGDESHARAAGGSGLGLSIAKTIIEAMDGSIIAQNDEGAKIRIFLEYS